MSMAPPGYSIKFDPSLRPLFLEKINKEAKTFSSKKGVETFFRQDSKLGLRLNNHDNNIKWLHNYVKVGMKSGEISKGG